MSPIRTDKHRAVDIGWAPAARPAAEVGAWFGARRKELGLTQREAAEQGFCSSSWLCQIETGTIDPLRISLDSLPRLCLAYQSDPQVVLSALWGASCLAGLRKLVKTKKSGKKSAKPRAVKRRRPTA